MATIVMNDNDCFKNGNDCFKWQRPFTKGIRRASISVLIARVVSFIVDFVSSRASFTIYRTVFLAL